MLVKYDTFYNSFNSSHTTNIAEHIPSGYAITVVRHHNKSSKTKYYRGRDCSGKLCDELKHISNKLINTKEKPHIPLTTDQVEIHANAKTCFICNRYFNYNKKANIIKILRKLYIITITLGYMQVLHMLYVV